MAGFTKQLYKQMTKLPSVNRIVLNSNSQCLKPSLYYANRQLSNKSSNDNDQSSARDSQTGPRENKWSWSEESKSRMKKAACMLAGGATVMVVTPIAVAFVVPTLQSASAVGFGVAAYTLMGTTGAVAGNKAYTAWKKFRSKDGSK